MRCAFHDRIGRSKRTIRRARSTIPSTTLRRMPHSNRTVIQTQLHSLKYLGSSRCVFFLVFLLLKCLRFIMMANRADYEDRHSSEYHNPESHSEQQSTRQRWILLFAFTNRTQSSIFIIAFVLSLLSGAAPPAIAIVFGRYFNAFSQLSSGDISVDVLADRVYETVYILTGIACANWILKSAYYSLWTKYGAMQARTVRSLLFQSLLQKEQDWYETGNIAITPLLAQLQM